MAETPTLYGKSPAVEVNEFMKAFNRLPREVQHKASAELGWQLAEAEYQRLNFGKLD